MLITAQSIALQGSLEQSHRWWSCELGLALLWECS